MNNKYKNLDIKVKKKLNWDFLGFFNSAFKWLWVEFESLREYIPWDSIKAIDWKTTAKIWEVFVKNYEEEKDIKVLFIIENTESLDFWAEKKTKKDILEEVFFILAHSSILSWYSIWVIINNEFFEFKKSEENIIRVFKILEKPTTSVSLKDIEWEFIQKLNIKNTLIFFLNDDINPNIPLLKYLNIRNELCYINVFDYFENNLSSNNFEINISWNRFFNLFLWNSNKIEDYKLLRIEKLKKLKKSLKNLDIEYLSVDDKDDIFLAFYKFFNNYLK